MPPAEPRTDVQVLPVDAHNWRDVARLGVLPEQREFVAEPTYYLCLCAYGTTWRPLAVVHDERVVGFLMWGIDPADDSTWLGGVIVDAAEQGKGFGGAAVRAAIAHLHEQLGSRTFALSYQPQNRRAQRLYARLGFRETGEMEDGEVVARFEIEDGPRLA